MGPGVATGGTANQVLKKVDSTDYNTTWGTIAGAVYQASAPSSPQTGDVWVDSDAVAGVLNQNDYLLKADASASTGYVSKVGGDTVIASSAAVKPLVLKGASSQTANLQEWQDSTGAVVASVSPTGNIVGGGLVHINTITVSGASTLTVSNVFTSAFENYKLEWVGTGSHTSATTMLFNVSTSGTAAPANWERMYITTGDSYGPTRVYAGSQSSAAIGSGGDALTTFDATIFRPAVASRTGVVFQSNSRSSVSADTFQGGGNHTSSVSYDGIILSASNGTITGTLRVYGLRN